MGTRARPLQHGRVARLLILLPMPAPLGAEQADTWLRDAVAGLSAHAAVERAELTIVGPGSRRSPRHWDRMIELLLTDDTDPRTWTDTGPCGEWLADLRSLRLQPDVVFADATTVIRVPRRPAQPHRNEERA